MRREYFHLNDIIERAASIELSLSGRACKEFLTDEVIRDATLCRLIMIDEAVAQLPPTVRQRYPDVNWSVTTAIRKQFKQSFFATDWERVWAVATVDARELARQVAEILAHDYPPGIAHEEAHTLVKTDPIAPLDLPLEALADFCRRWRVTKLSLFGSALRSDFGPESDDDFLVAFAPDAEITFVTLGQMERELEALLGRTIDRGTRLKPLIRDEVLASARVLYEEVTP